MNDFNEFSKDNIEIKVVQTTEPEKTKKPKKNHTTAKVTALLLAVVILGGGAGFGGAYLTRTLNPVQTAVVDNSSTPNESGTTSGSSQQGAPTLNDMQKDASTIQYTVSEKAEFNSDGTYKYTRDLVKAVQDSIVYIEVFRNYRGKSQLAGSASGIIISSDGYIVTNNHVVDGADSYTVKVNCSDESGAVTSHVYDAELMGTDSDTDLAVIKIDAKDLPVAVLGDSDKLCLGDDVVAIVNPLGLENSVSIGYRFGT